MLKTLMPQANEYLFNKKESVIVKPSHLFEAGFATQYAQVRTIAGMLCNLNDLGYTIPRDELPKLYNMSEQELNELVYQPMLKAAKEAKGANVEHRVLFPGFPESVRNVDIQTLSDIRFISYFTTFMDSISGTDALSDGSITTGFVKTAVQNAMDNLAKHAGVDSLSWSLNHLNDEKTFYKSASDVIDGMMKRASVGLKEKMPRVVHLVDDNAYFDMVKNMLSARASLSDYDKQIVTFTIDNFDTKQYMPEKIQFKENQALVDKYNFEKGYLYNIDIKTVKDFQRLLASLSDQDVSLSSKTIVRNFSNQERKKLIEIFGNAIKNNRPLMVESMANAKALRFADNVLKNRLHFNKSIGETYKSLIADAKKHESVMGAFERNMQDHKYSVAAKVLAKHSPTLFLQHVREIIGKLEVYVRKDTNKQQDLRRQYNSIIDLIKSNAKKVDIKTLLSLEKEIVKQRQPYKIMMPKSPTASIVVKANNSADLGPRAKATIVNAIEDGIKYQIQNHKMEGPVKIGKGVKLYISPDLTDCPIPTVGRSDTGKNRTLAPGSKVPVEQGNILRAALYKQNKVQQFIDFSAAIFDKNFQMIGQVSWNNLKEERSGQSIAYHSGDTRACDGPGCTEIIDIDLNLVKKLMPEAKHVAYMAVMWDGNPINTCDQIFMTLAPTDEMGKENGEKFPAKGASYSTTHGQDMPYNPTNVQFKVDITGEATASIPMFYNIETGKAMIVNMESTRKDFRSVTSNQKHFNLPIGCECLENYASDLSLKCFAYDNLNTASLGDLARVYAEYSGATIVPIPELADVVFSVDRTPVEDMRHRENNEELEPQVIITPYDKDVITAELIIDPKSIGDIIEPIEIGPRIAITEIDHEDQSIGDR